MAEMLLINPRKRRSAGAKRRKAPSAKQRANWARFAKAARARASGARAANPIRRRRVGAKRRGNPISVSRVGRSITRRIRRRSRNPISLGSVFNFRSYMTPIKDAAIMGAGAVAMDVGYAYVNRMLPAMLQRTPGALGIGDAVKVLITVAIGRLLSKPTRGLSSKAAHGALVVQAYNAVASFLPSSAPVNGLGWATAGRVVTGNSRVNANSRAMRGGQIGQYVGGASPLLNGPGLSQYVGGNSPLLSRAARR